MTNSSLYLAHHGILGQKWSVRRYQNSDGSLTDAGRKRYSSDVKGAEEKYNKALNIYNNSYSSSNHKQAKVNLKYAKEDLKNEQIKEKINKKGGLTKTQEKYKNDYMNKGLNEEEAAIAAYKKDMTKKALMVGAAVAITAVGAYAGYKYGEYSCDKILKNGTLLSRVAQTDSAGVHDAFYAVLDKNAKDKDRYAGIYGHQLRNRGKQVFEKTIGANADLKIASPKHAAEIMGKTLDSFNVRNNPREAENLNNLFKQWSTNDRWAGIPKRAKIFDKAQKELDAYVKTGKVGRNLYDALNINLANRNMNVTKQFYKDLKSAGYSGIKDINDSKYSGFMTKFPVIIADASKVKVSSVKKLGDYNIRKAETSASIDNLRKVAVSATKPLAVIAGTAKLGSTGVKASTTARNNQIVADYRKEHPNSKLSYNEILKIYDKK